MFTGEQIVAELLTLGITHVVWLPDSTLGVWEGALQAAKQEGLHLVRVCREAEAWAIAMGLHLGGARPLVIIQCTGLFDSGDALRNAIFDYGVPLFALIGYRNALNPDVTDSARTFTEPLLRAWQIDYCRIDSPAQLPLFGTHYSACRTARRPGVVLLAEGRM